MSDDVLVRIAAERKQMELDAETQRLDNLPWYVKLGMSLSICVLAITLSVYFFISLSLIGATISDTPDMICTPLQRDCDVVGFGFARCIVAFIVC